MGRKRRGEVADGIFHVYARGNNKQTLFTDDRDRARYLMILGDVVHERRWRCLSYCLMGNHIHLLVQTPQANLARGMFDAHGAYARSFNARHGRINHLFGKRYDASQVHDIQHLQRIAAYIALNPVDAGLCRKPEDWTWSSTGALLGLDPVPAWLDVDGLLARLTDGRTAGSDVFHRLLVVLEPLANVG